MFFNDLINVHNYLQNNIYLLEQPLPEFVFFSLSFISSSSYFYLKHTSNSIFDAKTPCNYETNGKFFKCFLTRFNVDISVSKRYLFDVNFSFSSFRICTLLFKLEISHSNASLLCNTKIHYIITSNTKESYIKKFTKVISIG